VRKFLLILACAGMMGAGCSSTPAPVTSPGTAASSASASASAAPDLMVRDVSVVKPLELTRQLIGGSYTVKIVPLGAQIDCTPTSSTTAMTLDGSATQTPFYCQEGYVAVPASIQKLWKTWPAIVIWYFSAKAGVFSDPVYNANDAKASCAAAYVASKRIDYTRDVEGEKLIGFVRGLHGDTEAAYVNAGLTAAASGYKISACKG